MLRTDSVTMDTPAARFFFDLVDPCSFLLEERLRAVESEDRHDGREVRIVRHPLELVVPPDPLLDPEGDAWRERARLARDAAPSDFTLVSPRLVPWSRKAHELVLHASEVGDDPDTARDLRRALFHAFHREGIDIGRVDRLLEVAEGVGLERSAAKAVLDVDRHLEPLRALREEAERLGVPGVPSFFVKRRWLTGIPDADTLREMLSPAESR